MLQAPLPQACISTLSFLESAMGANMASCVCRRKPWDFILWLISVVDCGALLPDCKCFSHPRNEPQAVLVSLGCCFFLDDARQSMQLIISI